MITKTSLQIKFISKHYHLPKRNQIYTRYLQDNYTDHGQCTVTFTSRWNSFTIVSNNYKYTIFYTSTIKKYI